LKIELDKPLNVKDNSVDVVFLFHVLHHMMDNVYKRLEDIYRILKPNGILCIKDHDVRTKEQAINVSFQHYVYELFTSKESVFDLAKNFRKEMPMIFYNSVELDTMLKEVGFERIYFNKNKNLTYTFEAVYKKTGKVDGKNEKIKSKNGSLIEFENIKFMDPNAFAILSAASSGDYKKLKELPKIENQKEAEQVEIIIRNMALKNKDRKLINSYPILARKALLDAVDSPKTFDFLLGTFYGPGSHYSLDFPSYVAEKIETKEMFEMLIEHKINFLFMDLSEKGKKEYLKALEDHEIEPYLAADILEELLNKNETIREDNYFIGVLSDFGYDLPKKKHKGETVNDRAWRLFDELRK
jgi:predicted SAM-dependent methyltransferase